MAVTPELLHALRCKYVELRRLRDAAATGLTADPREAMAALAQRFPGSLRELDRLPMRELEARLAGIDRAIEGRDPLPAWVPLQISYHGVMRSALWIRRSFARGSEAAAVLRALQTQYFPAPDEPDLASFDLATVQAILTPSGGRLNPWAEAWVAERHRVSIDRVRQALLAP